MDTRRYTHVVETVRRTPWAIRPEVLERIIAVLAVRASGERYSAEEIAGRIGAGPPARAPRTVGSVAVLPLYGVLFPKASLLGDMSGGTSLGRFRASFREAVASQVVSGIVLDVDSPGGLVDLVPETATEIRQARGRKPIVAVANTEAASAAYWIASQADELVVTPSGQVGSIGVFAAHNDISRAQDMAGVKTTLITAGRYKAEANPFEPLSEEARAAIQRTVDDYYRMFTLDVARGRSVPVEAVRQGYGEGRMLTAQAALTAGMVDRIASRPIVPATCSEANSSSLGMTSRMVRSRCFSLSRLVWRSLSICSVDRCPGRISAMSIWRSRGISRLAQPGPGRWPRFKPTRARSARRR